MVTTMTAAMLGAVVAAVAGAALAPVILPPAHAAAGEPGTLAFSFGERGSSSPYEFTRIRDVAMAPDGKIVVLDGRTRDALRIFHPNGTLHAGVDFSSAPASRDKVYVAPNGSILVKSGASIKTFDPNGVYVSTLAVQRTWGDGRSYSGHLSFAPDGNIIVIQNASRIAVLYPNGTHAFSFGQSGGYYGELSHVRFVDVGPAGRFFVESGNGRIEVFHPNGTHASTASFSLWRWDIGSSGLRYNGMFEIGPSGEFIASYRSASGPGVTLRIFYPNGTLAGSIDHGMYWDRYNHKFGTGLGVIVGHSSDTVKVFHGIDSAGVQLAPPSFVVPPGPPAYLPPAYLPPGPPAYVPPAARPLSLAGGTFAFEFGSYGEGPGEFLAPRNIAFGPGGVIAVSDAENNRVQLFHPNGTFAFELGSRGSGPGELAGPYGLTFGPNGLLAVSDVGNHRVQVFRIQ